MADDDTTVVAGQRWPDLPTPPLGDWAPHLRVCVILPARDCQEELDRTLASLARQTYPAELLEVLVVDDASTPPLRLPAARPAHTRTVRREEVSSHGSGPARHAGALATDAPVLLFLDADMVADRSHVEAHARWHHVCDHAVVLGRKWFVDFAGVSAGEVLEATGTGDLTGLLEGRRMRGHEWQEDLIATQDRLTRDRDDAFLAVVGASVSVRSDLYRRAGGFAAFGLRGIVDTEFGYRAYTAGGLLVPDDQAVAYHQGARSFAVRGDEIKLQRTGLAANHLPIPLFRPGNRGRRWAVPQVGVVVDAGDTAPELVQVCVDSVLASDVTDLGVTVVHPEGGEPPSWLRDYFAHETRVAFTTTPPRSAFPSPVTAVVPAGLTVSPDTVGGALTLLAEEGAGVVRTHPADTGGSGVEVWRTRALERTLASRPEDLDARAAELFGERWVPAPALGVRVGRYRVTRQGMLVGQ